MQEKQEEIKKHFEANMLDGDDVKNCGGAMLSAESVLEYISSLHSTWVKEMGEKIEKKFYVYAEEDGSYQYDPQGNQLVSEIINFLNSKE